MADLACGTAAEHLVCADLLLSGFRAFLTDQNCPYDVAVEHEGRLVRIQVKATRCARAVPQRVRQRPAYMWHVRRAGKAGKRTYSRRDFDLLALVATDIRRIAYVPFSDARQTVHIRTHNDKGPSLNGGRSGKVFADFPFAAALAGVRP